MKKLLIVSLMFVIASVSYFFWEVSYAAKAAGPVNPSSVTSGNVFVQVWGKNAAGSNVWVGCIVKPDANGDWYILSGSHQNVGCTGVSQDSDSIDVTYSAMDKIVTSSIDADESMVINRYHAGASVGLSQTIIQIGN